MRTLALAPTHSGPSLALALILAQSRALIRFRPSLIWSWDKLDVLPVIPVFNIASALGVPFIDKTIRVEELGKAIVAGLADEGVRGVQRFPEMEDLAKGLELPAAA